MIFLWAVGRGGRKAGQSAPHFKLHPSVCSVYDLICLNHLDIKLKNNQSPQKTMQLEPWQGKYLDSVVGLSRQITARGGELEINSSMIEFHVRNPIAGSDSVGFHSYVNSGCLQGTCNSPHLQSLRSKMRTKLLIWSYQISAKCHACLLKPYWGHNANHCRSLKHCGTMVPPPPSPKKQPLKLSLSLGASDPWRHWNWQPPDH